MQEHIDARFEHAGRIIDMDERKEQTGTTKKEKK